MAYFDKVLSALAAVAVLGACGDKTDVPADPEAQHCVRAAERLTRDVGNIQIIEAKAWTNGDVRSVRVRFAYPENTQGLSNGNVMCVYAYPVTVRGDKGRRPQAQSIYFRARHLSENELLLLNMALRGT